MSASSNQRPELLTLLNLPMSKVLPGAIIGLIGLIAVGGIVGNWAMDMWYSSVRIEGQYGKRINAIPAPAVLLPKDSYLCPPNAKSPWLGCSIR